MQSDPLRVFVGYDTREREAYAMAMRDWRLQVDACNRGHQRACDMPPPNPADYM